MRIKIKGFGSLFRNKARRILLFCLLCMPSSIFAQDYFPIALGNSWIFNQVDSLENTTGTDSVVIDSNYSVLNLNVFLWAEYFSGLPISGTTSLQLFNDSLNGNDVFVLNTDSSTYKLHQHQYNDGDFWMVNSDSVKVSYLGLVTVPAGSFSSCYYVYSPTGFGAGIETGWVVAPDVGAIKSMIGGTVRMVLASYSIILGINSPLVDANIILSPNPTLNLLNIHNPYQTTGIQILDINGRQVFSETCAGEIDTSVNTSNLATGMYFVNISVGKRTITKMLVKQ